MHLRSVIAMLVLASVFTACKKAPPPEPAVKAAPRTGVSVGAESDAAGGGAAPPPAAAAQVATEDPGPAPVKLAEPMIRINPSSPPEELAQKLTDAVNVFEEWYGGKSPSTLQQLVDKRILDQVPAAPAGMKYVINPQRHSVELRAE